VTSPVAPIASQLLNLHEDAKSVITEAAEKNAAKLGRLVQFDMDIVAWVERITGRPEQRQLRDGRHNLGYAIYSASSGLYVQAYASLRLFLELSFASIYFSANELHRRKWAANRADFSWAKALDEKEGVLSPNFVREFSESASIDASSYALSAARCYRHCSEFVHGKLAVTESLPETLSYSQEVMTDWIDTAIFASEAVLYLIYSRYGDELLPIDDGQLSATLEDAFYHLRQIRQRIGLPVEEVHHHGQ